MVHCWGVGIHVLWCGMIINNCLCLKCLFLERDQSKEELEQEIAKVILVVCTPTHYQLVIGHCPNHLLMYNQCLASKNGDTTFGNCTLTSHFLLNACTLTLANSQCVNFDPVVLWFVNFDLCLPAGSCCVHSL